MLYDRIIRQGTVNEPTGKPDPQFALPATVNWMRAIAILTQHNHVEFSSALHFYSNQQKRDMSSLVENTIFEQLLLSLHHLSTLEQFRGKMRVADYARIGILAWYYGITNAASAMTAAQSGSFQEDHAGTARLWDVEIASRGLAMPPFSWRVTSLVEATYKPEIVLYKNGSNGKLLEKPNNAVEAAGAAGEYLSGTAAWHTDYVKEALMKSTEFRDLDVSDFRTKAAREMRDRKLSRKPVGFLHQASRYRGKANYREALYLGYGPNTETILTGLPEDLAIVLRSFLAMAGAFAKAKLGKSLWNEFVDDIDKKRAFSLKATEVWG